MLFIQVTTWDFDIERLQSILVFLWGCFEEEVYSRLIERLNNPCVSKGRIYSSSKHKVTHVKCAATSDYIYMSTVTPLS